MRKRLSIAVARSSGAGRASSEIGGDVLFVGAISAIVTLAAHPLLPLAGGLGLSVLFVVARSRIKAQEQRSS